MAERCSLCTTRSLAACDAGCTRQIDKAFLDTTTARPSVFNIPARADPKLNINIVV